MGVHWFDNNAETVWIRSSVFMVISKVVPGSVFPLSMALKMELIQDRAIKNSEQRWMTPLRIWITQTERYGGGVCQKTGYSVCGRKRQLVYSFLLPSVFLRSPRSPELISFSTSSCFNSLLLTDCQRWLADKNVNFQITCSSGRLESPFKIQHFLFQGFL